MRHFYNLLSTSGRSQILLATLTLALALPTPARAAVVTSGDVDPADPTTWDFSTKAYIGKTALGTLTVDGGSSVDTYRGRIGSESGSDGTATVSGSGSTWEMRYELIVGYRGTGTLTIDSGGLVKSRSGYLGYESGSEGTATVSGSGSTWELSQSLNVGGSGTGTLNIHDGGLVKCGEGRLGDRSGSEGTVTVSGSGSTWEVGSTLDVGRYGTGTLNIHEGGLVKSVGGDLGYKSGSDGTATVSGSGSTWDIGGYYYNSRFYVGRYGTGTLNIHDGGLVKGGGGYIGRYSGSDGTVTVSGSGSTWEMDYSLSVGDSGTGVLNIHDGGLVKSSDGRLALLSGSEGTATVSGSGSTWEMRDELYIGNRGTGTLNIHDGGLVSVGGETYVNRYNTGSKIVFDGGSLETESIFASPDDFQGVGTIKANGWVLDADVTINTSTLVHSFAITDPATSTNISLQIDQTGTVYDLGDVGAGYRGAGTLRIDSGGLVKSSGGYLGFGSGSAGTATVSGGGSTWDVGGGLRVGNYGTGTLNIQDGGLVKSGGGYLGYRPGSEGTATVSGSGSTWDMSSSLSVGRYGTGMLNIHDGGLVKSRFGYLGYYSGSAGTATVSGSGSTWEMSDRLSVGRSGTGTLNIHDGGLVSVGNDVSVNSTSMLAFGIGSSGSGLLDVGGNVALDGAFGVSLLDGYMPDVGNSFTLVQADGPGGISGLSQVDMMAALPAIDWWLAWESDYTEGSSELTISVGPEPTPFPLDIRPGSDKNRLNLKSKGVLPVSILTSDGFDALTVDMTTLLFGDPLLIDKETTPLPPIRFNEGDVNDDGLLDLTLFFSIPDLLDAGMLGPSSEEAFLFGALFDGTEIFSSDILGIVPKPKGNVLGTFDEAEALTMGRSASISPIPEPGTLALLCMGVVGFLAHGWRRRSS